MLCDGGELRPKAFVPRPYSRYRGIHRDIDSRRWKIPETHIPHQPSRCLTTFRFNRSLLCLSRMHANPLRQGWMNCWMVFISMVASHADVRYQANRILI